MLPRQPPCGCPRPTGQMQLDGGRHRLRAFLRLTQAGHPDPCELLPGEPAYVWTRKEYLRRAPARHAPRRCNLGGTTPQSVLDAALIRTASGTVHPTPTLRSECTLLLFGRIRFSFSLISSSPKQRCIQCLSPRLSLCLLRVTARALQVFRVVVCAVASLGSPRLVPAGRTHRGPPCAVGIQEGRRGPARQVATISLRSGPLPWHWRRLTQ